MLICLIQKSLICCFGNLLFNLIFRGHRKIMKIGFYFIILVQLIAKKLDFVVMFSFSLFDIWFLWFLIWKYNFSFFKKKKGKKNLFLKLSMKVYFKNSSYGPYGQKSFPKRYATTFHLICILLYVFNKIPILNGTWIWAYGPK